MKKHLSLLLAAVLSFTMIATACGKTDSTGDSNDSSASVSTTAPNVTTASGGDIAPPVTTALPEVSSVRYAYSQLNDEEKKMYSLIVEGVNGMSPFVTFPREVSYDEFIKVWLLVYFQEPQLYWFRGSYEVYDGMRDSFPLIYRYDPEQVKTMTPEIDAAVADIMASIPKDADTMDKLKIFHDSIALKGDFTKEGPPVQTIYGGLVDGRVQCEGYAKTLGYLCDKAGIENMLVPGSNLEGLSHAWNLVKIDGEWYNIDVTWDDPAANPDKEYFRFNYFGVTDAEILGKSHVQDTTTFTPPKATATKYNYQRHFGLYAETAADAKKLIAEQLLEAAKTKKPRIQIKVSSKAVFDELKKELVTDTGILAMLKEANKTAVNKLKDGTTVPALDENVLTLQFGLSYE